MMGVPHCPVKCSGGRAQLTEHCVNATGLYRQCFFKVCHEEPLHNFEKPPTSKYAFYAIVEADFEKPFRLLKTLKKFNTIGRDMIYIRLEIFNVLAANNSNSSYSNNPSF